MGVRFEVFGLGSWVWGLDFGVRVVHLQVLKTRHISGTSLLK